MKRIFALVVLLAVGLTVSAQTDWKKVEKLINDGSCKTAYSEAEKVFRKAKNSGDLLASVWYMNKAAVAYQEDAHDSAVARFRSILPRLEAPERAVCYALLGEKDSALMDEQELKKTSADRVRRYCRGTEGMGVDLTPTVFDVVVQTMVGISNNDAVELLGKLIDFHKNDGDDIRIMLDLELMGVGSGWTVVSNQKKTEEVYKDYINKYRASSCMRKTQFYSGLAKWLCDRGRYKEALRYCDTAISMAPKSAGGREAHEQREKILRREITFDSYGTATALPGRPSLQLVSYRNVGHLYFGIAAYDEGVKEMRVAPKVFRRWEMDVDTSDRYNPRSILFDVPALEAGRWILVVSEDGVFDKEDAMLEIRCTDMKVLRMSKGVYQLVNAISGEPIRDQEVQFYEKRGGKGRMHYSAFTDADGRVRYEGETGQIFIRIERQGNVYEEDNWYYAGEERMEKRDTWLFCDRPVYRPGDTAHVAMVHYETDLLHGHTVSGHKVTFVLYDPNGEERERVEGETDDFGVASAMFVIPKDGLAGGWDVMLQAEDDYDFGNNDMIYLTVEEFKQPKFMVSLDATANVAGSSNALALGKPYTVRGLAQSYSGAKVDGARVKYTITRYTRYWRKMGGYDYYTVEDSTVTAADGSFDITFTPMADSTADLSQKPNFHFQILAEVTDRNGETHSAQTMVVAGYHNTTLKLAEIGQDGVSTLENVAFSLQDINGRPKAGEVKVALSRLHLPDTARLLPPVMLQGSRKLYNTLSRERFRELFPTYVYSKDEYQKNNMKSEWDWSTTEHITADEVKHTVKLPRLESGYYRVVATCGEEADTLYVSLTLPEERVVKSNSLIWADIQYNNGEENCRPGDRITLRYASAFDDVRFLYVLADGNSKELDLRWLPAGRGIKQISIAIDSAMLGGCTVNLFAVKDGVTSKWYKYINVPFLHKNLDVEIATFRDKLQPGEVEEWTIKVSPLKQSNNQTIKQSGNLIMTMYDDALTTYGGPVSFMDYPWREGGMFYRPELRRQYGFYRGYYSKFKTYMGSDPEVSFWVLDFSPLHRRYGRMEKMLRNYSGTARGEGNMVTMQGNVRKRTANSDVEVHKELVIDIGSPESGARMTAEDIAHMPGNSVDAVVAAVGGMGYSDEFEEEEVLSSGGQRKPVQVRSNLSTLAFFVSDLRTDATGTATYRFRVPELLTRWRVAGIAFTNDLKVGLLDRTVVTQKSLMVQPNIPRFLRHGDSIVLMAKVMNLTDEERKVQVHFSLKNADSDINTFTSHRISYVTVPAQGSAQVTFPISNLPRDLYVATYEITAQTCDEKELPNRPYFSDGERGQIPVVTDRQAVTLSQPVYINGAGEKSFTFHLSPLTSTAEPHFLGAELVSNPVWLAVKSMPYLKQQENPSTIYLANSLYVNTLANNILKDFNDLKDLKTLTDTTNTRLKINEDVKQTLLEATPWLRDAESEMEQRQAIANYFDRNRLGGEQARLVAQLSSLQNDDGGWSWMPEGESSLWTTMQILKRLVPCAEAMSAPTQLALKYIDREEQRHYDKYIKPYLKKGYKWEPDNIDYLYTRSFYGKGTTEAYKFYYKNALKNYKNYTGLYTQAQLALIFQRHGDKKAAKDLIRRLKEKSLESDELGMYWRDNHSGWCWYERPIETQALLIQAFREVTPKDTVSIALMQQWLLKQKQTTHWGNDRATVEAISALMTPDNPNTPSNPNTLSALNSTTLNLCGIDLSAPSEGLEGYRSQRWEGPALDSIISLGDSTITLRKTTSGIAWGSVYFQYTDDMDKIPSSESGITLKRTYLHEGPWKVGDRVRVRIEISVDRNMEYLELIDGRPSCVEPLSTRAGWNWSGGLRYYVEVKNTATHCYINRLEKGKYIVEYEVYVTNPGTFLAGPVTMQCMYAPEFRATAPAQRLTVE